MLLLVAVSVIVICSINVDITLIETTENRPFCLYHSRDILVLNFYVRGKIR